MAARPGRGPLIDRASTGRGTAVCLHGFTRSGHRLQHLAHRLQHAGISALRPSLGSLWWPDSMNNPRVIARLADALLTLDELSMPTVIIGHSAGAAAGCRLAAELGHRGVPLRGLVLVDGVESPTRHIERSWPAIEHLPLRAVAAPGSPCNRRGALSTWLADRLPNRFGTLVAGSTHGDIEADPHWIYRLTGCGSSDEATRRHVVDLVCGHARWLLGSRVADGPWADRPGDLPLIGRR